MVIMKKILTAAILIAITSTTLIGKSEYRKNPYSGNNSYSHMEKVKKRSILKAMDIQKCFLMAETRNDITRCENKVIGYAKTIRSKHKRMDRRETRPQF